MLVKVHGSAVQGIEATLVTAEVNVVAGYPTFTIVGLGDKAVHESYQRLFAAFRNNDLYFPHGKRVTINLAPADLPKEGTGYDLMMAAGLLAGTGEVPVDRLATHLVMGELALGGRSRGHFPSRWRPDSRASKGSSFLRRTPGRRRSCRVFGFMGCRT